MDITQIIHAIILGIVEGLTEFLPVSSTGHLLIARDLLGFDGVEGNVFEFAIQIGAILAVCVLYFKRLTKVATTLHTKSSRNFVYAILIAMLPAAILGITINDYITEHFYNIESIAISLILGGIAIIAIEDHFKKNPRIHKVEEIDRNTAIKIGIVQCLSMLPGTSRSGATIMGALLAGVNRKVAAEFSFFLAIPTIIGATVLNLYKTWGSIDDDAFHLILIGGAVSFITALVVVNGMIGFVSKNGFKPFAYYRIVLGALLLSLY